MRVPVVAPAIRLAATHILFADFARKGAKLRGFIHQSWDGSRDGRRLAD